jgi:hypothetical protein
LLALSTTEAEYMALALISCHMIWNITALKELNQHYKTEIHADSTGAIDLSKNGKVSQR